MASAIAFSLQCKAMGNVNAWLQLRFNSLKPENGGKQWSMSYIFGCAIATITIYCSCFGEQLWKSTPTWVRSLNEPCGCQSGLLLPSAVLQWS